MSADVLVGWRRSSRYALTFSVTVFLAACGGGGGGETASRSATATCTTANSAGCTSEAERESAETQETAARGGTADPGTGSSSPGAAPDTGSDRPAANDAGSPSTEREAPASGAAGSSASPAAPSGRASTPSAPSGTAGGSSPASPAGPASSPAPAPFDAYVTIAPDDGAVLAGAMLLEVRGSAIRNAELLPADGYLPRLSALTVVSDGSRASTDFDTRTLPNGRLAARILAFDSPAGQTGTEKTAMPARTWLIRNEPAPVGVPIPPPSVMPEVHMPLNSLPYVDPRPLEDLVALDDAAYEAMLREDWPHVSEVMHRYIPAHVILYPPTPKGFSGPWDSCMGNPALLSCREAMRYMIDVMRGKAS